MLGYAGIGDKPQVTDGSDEIYTTHLLRNCYGIPIDGGKKLWIFTVIWFLIWVGQGGAAKQPFCVRSHTLVSSCAVVFNGSKHSLCLSLSLQLLLRNRRQVLDQVGKWIRHGLSDAPFEVDRLLAQPALSKNDPKGSSRKPLRLALTSSTLADDARLCGTLIDTSGTN